MYKVNIFVYFYYTIKQVEISLNVQPFKASKLILKVHSKY